MWSEHILNTIWFWDFENLCDAPIGRSNVRFIASTILYIFFSVKLNRSLASCDYIGHHITTVPGRSRKGCVHVSTHRWLPQSYFYHCLFWPTPLHICDVMTLTDFVLDLQSSCGLLDVMWHRPGHMTPDNCFSLCEKQVLTFLEMIIQLDTCDVNINYTNVYIGQRYYLRTNTNVTTNKCDMHFATRVAIRNVYF